MIYLLHFSSPLHHARHYIGWTTSERSLKSRLEYHESGRGSKLLAAAVEHGITWEVALVFPGTRDDERKLKNRKNAPRMCPLCKEAS